MSIVTLAPHDGLWEGSRLRGLTSSGARIRAHELAFLALSGFVAAVVSAYLEFRLRIPGHAILRAVLPMALGLAVVPRRGAGTVMGVSALVSGLGIRMLHPAVGLSLGALASLTLTGPLLDLALRHARGGWRLYGGFALAGLGANVVAFLARGGAKALGLEHLGARPLGEWMVTASVSYVICGLLAGLVSGAIWFQATRPRGRRQEQSA
jgi:hypothetical protein